MHERAIPIVSHDELRELAADNPNLLHDSPWIVTGYIERWPTYAQWQDTGVLRERFGALKAFAKAPNFVTNRKSQLVSVETSFAQYLDYIANPERVREIYDGCWMEGGPDEHAALGLPLYCGTLRIVHHAREPVLAELDPLVPPPLADWNHALPYYYSLFNHFWLLVSLPGALTPLHQDNNGTIALIAQLKGRKRAILYSPADLPHIYNPEVGYLDPLDPDPVDFPSHRAAVAWTGDLEPGQVLFVGTNWAHHVRTLETSISVSYDFINHSNLAAYATSSLWAGVFGDRIKRNPALVVGKLPGAPSLAEITSLPSVVVGRTVMAQLLRASIPTHAEATDTVADIRRQYLAHLEAGAPATTAHPAQIALAR